ALEDVLDESADVLDIEIRVVLARRDQEILRERALAEAEDGVRDRQELLGDPLAPWDVALASDREKERMHARGIDRVERVNAGNLLGDDGRGDLVDQLSEGRVLLRRPADHGEGPDRIAAMPNLLDAQEGEIVDEAVVAEVIAERAFRSGLARVDRAGDDEVGIRRDEIA